VKDLLTNKWVDPLDNQGDFNLNGGTYDMPPGTYYFRNMKLVGGSTLNILGTTKIYLTGDLDRHGGAVINNNTQLAGNLVINMTGPGKCTINSDNVFYGVVYAPNSDVTVNGTADFFGAIVGKTLKITGDATGHYDESLDLDLGSYATRVMLVD
jgi:hypothetical protein